MSVLTNAIQAFRTLCEKLKSFYSSLTQVEKKMILALKLLNMEYDT